MNDEEYLHVDKETTSFCFSEVPRGTKSIEWLGQKGLQKLIPQFIVKLVIVNFVQQLAILLFEFYGIQT